MNRPLMRAASEDRLADVSPYLRRPLRSLDRALADIATKQPTRFRWYVSGMDGCDWDTVPVFAVTAEAALSQAIDGSGGTKFRPREVDPIPDAMVYEGRHIQLDREMGRRIAILHALADREREDAR